MAGSDSLSGLEIAIVGMAGRFPGASSVGQFWKNIRAGVESISFFTDEECREAGVKDSLLTNPQYVKAGAFLDGADFFDSGFFELTPREAQIMDPQHRLFLECAWEVLEHACCDPACFPGAIGVYAGCAKSSYLMNNLYANKPLLDASGKLPVLFGNDKDFIATRVSYKLNFRGPAVTVQTACSTSLVAVHFACQALLAGECDMALAGGVSVRFPQKAGYVYQEEGIHSPDGHCRAFDAHAQGTVGGNGIGIVGLKRLEDALENRDTVFALIKGSSINNDGSNKVGFSAPSVEGQSQVIKTALSVAGVPPETIGYIETHGTGTALGDPIEIGALTKAFGTRSPKQSCAIGSLKSNVGHLDTAAGVAGLIKAALALQNGEIPPSLHYSRPNPHIDFANSPFYVNTTLSPWPQAPHPRRAGVSSFGMGGTNAHVILEEAPPISSPEKSRSVQLLVLSAKTPTALETGVTNLADFLESKPDISLPDVAYSLSVGRHHFHHRIYGVCSERTGAIEALRGHPSLKMGETLQDSQGRPVMFMFTGQGAQYVNMGHGLYQEEQLFQWEVDRCCESLRGRLTLDLRSLLFPSKENEVQASQQLNTTQYAQPALFVLEYALAKLWMSWGVHPKGMIGHSIGEYVAACLAGVFTLEEALGVVAARGRFMQAMAEGSMLSVGLPEQELQKFVNPPVSLAAVNSPSHGVISGPKAAINAVFQQLTEKGLTCRLLQTSHAFHSVMMEDMLEEYLDYLRQVKMAVPQIPFVSNLTGHWIKNEEATSPDYWSRHVRQPVRFSMGVECLLEHPNAILLEVGPGHTLSQFARQHRKTFPNMEVLSSIRHPKESHDDLGFLFNAVGDMWLCGGEIHWPGFYGQEERRRLPLTTYAFDRERYWVEPQGESESGSPQSLAKNPDVAKWFYLPAWGPSLLPDPIDWDTTRLSPQKCWLVLCDEYGIGDALLERVLRSNQRGISVKIGESFHQRNEREWLINPDNPQHFETVLEALQHQGITPGRIVHLWGVSQRRAKDFDLTQVEEVLSRSFRSILYLVQTLGRKIASEPLPWVFISNQVQGLSNEDDLSPLKATTLGLCKVIPQEYPHMTCRHVDIVVPPKTDKTWARMIDWLTREFADLGEYPVVAYREGRRWVQQYIPATLAPTTMARSLLRPGGVYLITGGIGRVGLALAEFIAKSVNAKLVLTCLSSFPEKPNWSGWLASHGKDDRTVQRITQLQALEALGTEVMVRPTDVAEEKQMRDLLNEMEILFGPINGVIHAAAAVGPKGFRTLQSTEKEDCDRHFRAKVQGTLVLEKLLQGKDIDFCLLTSSLASVLGGIRFGAYAAANCFLDAFAHRHRQTGSPPWISVNWDGWKFDDLHDVPPNASSSSITSLAMTASEGVETFHRILTQDSESQVVVSTGNLHMRLEQWILQKEDKKPEEAPDLSLLPSYARPLVKTAYVAPRNEIEVSVVNIWQELLGIKEVGIHDNFFELGGHSLLGTMMIARLKETFEMAFSLDHLFEYPTPSELGDRIKAMKWARSSSVNPQDSTSDEREILEL